MRTLFIGDIVGKPGRRAVEEFLPGLVVKHSINYVIANGENAAGGFGLTPEIAQKLRNAGVHGITMGNHLYDQKETEYMLNDDRFIARPENLPPGSPGVGHFILDSVAGPVCVISLQGRIFMTPIDCPFRVGLEIAKEMKKYTKAIIIDFHAEATSEKQAMGIYLDGSVSAVIGTHTHVQTADERVLPKGTGFITDVGMTGPHLSVIGMEPIGPITKMIDAKRCRFKVANDDVRICGVLIDIDLQSGHCITIQRLMISVDL